MKILPVKFTEQARSRLCVALAVLNCFSIIASVGLLALGAHIKVQVQRLDHIYIGYDNNSLPWLLVCMGILCLVINIMGAMSNFCAYDSTKRYELKSVLLIHMVLGALACAGVFAGGTMCYTSSRDLEEAFRDGIGQGMRNYVNNPITKIEMDELQMSYTCCGNDAYTDWFHVPWVLDKYHPLPGSREPREADTTTRHQGRATLRDDVPFSCCDPSAFRPCVHTSVHDNGRHRAYNYLYNLTLYKKGCRDAVMDYFADTLLVKGGACVFAIFLIQLALLLLSRYLQTSMFAAMDTGYPTAATQGYLLAFPCLPGGEADSRPAVASAASLTYHRPGARAGSRGDTQLFNEEHGFASDEFEMSETDVVAALLAAADRPKDPTPKPPATPPRGQKVAPPQKTAAPSGGPSPKQPKAVREEVVTATKAQPVSRARGMGMGSRNRPKYMY